MQPTADAVLAHEQSKGCEIMNAGSLFGRYSQPNGGLLGLAAGIMAGLGTAGIISQTVGGSSLGPVAVLAWAAAGALATWLLWWHQVVLSTIKA